MAFDLLPTLHPKSKHWVICVRVSRKWEYRGGADDGPILHVDLVLADEKGNAIYAEIPNSEVDTKSILIQEGGTYIISRFRVSKAKSLYRPVDGPYMIELTCFTKITPAKEVTETFPAYIYKLTPISDLRSHAGENKKFLDVLGIITAVSDTRLVQLPNQPRPTLNREVILKDLSNAEIKLTLWGQRAAEFSIDEVYNEEQANPIVVLIVGNLMKTYAGEEYLSGNTACRWYFNPTIPEAEEFYSSIANHRLPINHIAAPSQEKTSLREPLQLEDKYLSDLEAMDPYDFPEGGCRCTVTISRLVLTSPWWFPSCNRCSRTCIPDGDGYRCNTCSCTGYRFKYKLCFVANDGTAEAEMIAFGEVGRRIVGKPVQQVLRTARFASDTPPDISAIVSLKFTFAITLTEQSYYNPQRSYQINSVITAYGRQHTLQYTKSDQHRYSSSSQQPMHLLTHPTSSTTQPTSQTHNYPINPYTINRDPTIPSGSRDTTLSPQEPIQKTSTKATSANITPPPSLSQDESPLKKTELPDTAAAAKHSATRKRLFQDSTDTSKMEDSHTRKKSKNETPKAASDPLLNLGTQQITSEQTTSVTAKAPGIKPSHTQKNNT